jgi:hypothetical protein
MATTIDIRDEVSGALKALKEGLSPASVNPAIGAAEKKLFQNHFLGLPPNKRGWPTTGLYPKFARATNWHVLADGVLISVNRVEARQRYFGGEIHPKPGHKFLAIPARAEAYGKSPRDFSDLEPRIGSNGGALVQTQQSEVEFGRIRKDGSRKVARGQVLGGLVFFWLVKSVNQTADPSILPTDQEISDTAVAEAKAATDRSWRRN